ncbi:MAG: TonB family protein [Opitutae bacterium]|nr:TonB family protein [Opitutae bacterium]
MKRFNLLPWVTWLICAAAVMLQAGVNDSTVAALKLVKFVPPEFPAQLRLEGIPVGEVTLAVGRDAAGNPTDILPIEATHPAMADAAVAAVQQWRFEPMDAAGLFNRAPVLLRVSFSYEGVIFVFSNLAYDTARQERRDRPMTVRHAAALPAPPKPVSQPMPDYPKTLANQSLEGEARVTFYIDAEGHVRLPRVLEASTPEFGEAAVLAVANWRYETPRVRGEPVVVTDQWSFQFKKNN